MITRKEKQKLLDNLTEKIGQMKSAVFADYTGLTVAKMTELRRKLREQNVEMKVAKKTLINLALKKSGIESADIKKLPGQIAILLGFNDEVAPAKTAFNFAKTEDKLKLLGGILNNAYIDSASVTGLAKLPSKQELLGKAVGSISAPLSGMVNVLQGNLRGLVQVLSQIQKN